MDESVRLYTTQTTLINKKVKNMKLVFWSKQNIQQKPTLWLFMGWTGLKRGFGTFANYCDMRQNMYTLNF